MPDDYSANKARFTFKVGGTSLSVVSFSATEGMFSDYLVNLRLASKEDLSFDDFVGQQGCLTVYGLQGARYFHGLVGKFMMTGTQGDFRLYQANLVPTVWALNLTKDCRIFQEKSTPKIVEKVLLDAGISAAQFDMRLRGDYADREYCVQYHESNLAFISRLLSEEGIFFFFEHAADKHVLAFGDDPLNYQPIDGEMEVLFNPSKGMVSDEEYVYRFEFSRQIHTGKLSLKDFFFEKPTLDLTSDSQADQHNNLEIYEYPGRYMENGLGKDRSRIFLEEAMAFRDQADGVSNCPRLMPGKTFKLKTKSSRPEMSRKYLVVSVRHEGEQPQVLEQFAGTGEGYRYSNSFFAIPDTVVFRPTRGGAKPSVRGVQSAIVVGPAGEEIYTDKYGRVKVQFHWDRLGKQDDKSSCWVRVSQAWAGAGWGAMYIPRIGQEVIVSFIDGDPDRPIITGRVYHGDNMPPYALPGEKTKSTLKSNSTPGGGGSNEFRFEDKKGSEEIYLHGQKDWNTTIENDRNSNIGNNQTAAIGNDKTIQVGNNHTETIGSNMTITVGSNKSETVSINTTETIGVLKALTIGAAYQVSVGAAMNETIGAAKAEEIGGAKSVNIGAFSNENVGANKSINVGSNYNVSVGGKYGKTVTKEYSLKASKISIVAENELSIKVGGSTLVMKKNGEIDIKGKNINIKGSGKANIKFSKDITIKGSKIKEN